MIIKESIKATVILPAYNEETGIKTMLNKMKGIINNKISSFMFELLEQLRVKISNHQKCPKLDGKCQNLPQFFLIRNLSWPNLLFSISLNFI